MVTEMADVFDIHKERESVAKMFEATIKAERPGDEIEFWNPVFIWDAEFDREGYYANAIKLIHDGADLPWKIIIVFRDPEGMGDEEHLKTFKFAQMPTEKELAEAVRYMFEIYNPAEEDEDDEDDEDDTEEG
jgi:hypothetical protein